MGDMGEGWAEYHKERQEKRASNRASSTKILEEKGISFERKNMGAHLIVSTKEGKIDFWPGTGKWIVRGGKKGAGIKNLLKHIGEVNEQ